MQTKVRTAGGRRIDIVLVSANIIPHITKAWHCEYNEVTSSDHKAIGLDLNMKTLFGNGYFDPTAPETWILTMENARHIKKYITCLKHEFKIHNIESKVIELQKKLNKNQYCTQADITVYEGSSDQIMRAQKHSEHKCAKSQYRYEWSPILRDAGQKIMWWKKVVEIRKCQLLIPDQFYSYHGADDSVKNNITVSNAIREHKQAWSSLRKIQKTSKDARMEFLNEQAEFYAEKHERVLQNVIVQIKNVEQRKNNFTHLKRQLTNTRSGPLNHILIATEKNEWEAVRDSEAVQEPIMSNIYTEVLEQKAKEEIRRYTRKKMHWTLEQYNEIDWHTYEMNMRKKTQKN